MCTKARHIVVKSPANSRQAKSNRICGLRRSYLSRDILLYNVRSPFFTHSRDSLGEDPYLTGVPASKLSAGVESENVMFTLKNMVTYSNMSDYPRVSYMLGKKYNPDNIIVDKQIIVVMNIALAVTMGRTATSTRC